MIGCGQACMCRTWPVHVLSNSECAHSVYHILRAEQALLPDSGVEGSTPSCMPLWSFIVVPVAAVLSADPSGSKTPVAAAASSLCSSISEGLAALVGVTADSDLHSEVLMISHHRHGKSRLNCRVII